MSEPLEVFRDRLVFLKRSHTYEELAEWYEVNQYFLWKIINDEDYRPPVKVRRKLKVVMEDRPPRIAIRKDDPQSAAASILRNFETEKVRDLIILLAFNLPQYENVTESVTNEKNDKKG